MYYGKVVTKNKSLISSPTLELRQKSKIFFVKVKETIQKRKLFQTPVLDFPTIFVTTPNYRRLYFFPPDHS